MDYTIQTDLPSDLEELTSDIDDKLDPGWEDYYQLMNALRCRKKEIVKFLLQKGARVNKDPPVSRISTPLHLAVNLDCPEIVRLLLEKGASVSIQNHNHETPLIMAAKMGRNEIVDILLSVGEQINCVNREKISHLHIACMRNRVDIAKKLLQQGAQVNHSVARESLNWPSYTALHFAVRFQCTETVQFLVNCGADVTAKARNTLTPLHFANATRNETIIDILLSTHKYYRTNPCNSEGLSHFHIACTRNDPSIIKSFIQWGADINMAVYESSLNWPRYRPMNFAIDYQCTDVIKLLLAHNAILKFVNSDRRLINHAYETGNKTIINLLLSESTIKNANAASMQRLSEFHTACVKNDDSAIEEFIQYGNLMDKPVDVNLPIWTGCTPLHLAIRQKRERVAEVLLIYGSDVTLKDAEGKTPLHLAFESQQTRVVDLILTKYLNFSQNPVDNNGFSHFHIVCIRIHLSGIDYFLQNGVNINSFVHLNSVFRPGYTALHFAAEFQLICVVEFLLERGADITAKDGMGFTPLDVAIKQSYSNRFGRNETFQIIDLILTMAFVKNMDTFDSRGFSRLHVFCALDNAVGVENFLNVYPKAINEKITWAASSHFVDGPKSNWLGYTPMHFAAHFNNENALMYLQRKGADVSIEDAKGNTPASLYINNHGKFNLLGQLAHSYFHIHCSHGSSNAVQIAIERGVDVNQPPKFNVYDGTNRTPLHLAVHRSGKMNAQVVTLLLKNGANPNSRDIELNTPLILTTFNSTANMAKLLLSYGADINARNMHGETALMAFVATNDPSNRSLSGRIQFFLINGADINIEDKNGDIPFTKLHSWWCHFETTCPPVIASIIVLMRHIRKLKLIGHYVSKKNLQCYFTFLELYSAGVDDREEMDFLGACVGELERMKEVHLDIYTTLYSILKKDANRMALHSENATLQEITESPDLHTKYPIYGFALKSQFRKGLVRRPLLETAKVSLGFLPTLSLPDACSEKICQYLSNEDLQSIISSREKVCNI